MTREMLHSTTKPLPNRSPLLESLSLLWPFLIWGCLFLLRPFLYLPWCASIKGEPSLCLTNSVNSFDAIAFQFNSIRADFISNILQNGVGTIAVALPCLLILKHARASSINIDWIKIRFEWGLLLKLTLWNAAILEIFRAAAQRPRPLVFHNPLVEGLNVNHYTSFYSGHTSFVALASITLAFMLRDHFQSVKKTTTVILIFSALLLTLLTGTLRVIGGRHFPTDVIAGLIIGGLIGYYGNKKFRQLP